MESIPVQYRKKLEKLTTEVIPALRSVREIPGAEKLKGYSSYYKIRIGNYRLGFEEVDSGIVIHRIMHRKEIYRYFPD